ncbi:hypothetical protein FACS189419_07400 [Planctomycetales bacterium]|nr:hypothetical protein FACS189419_07400 [Planctomycetales bacterium]
MGKSFLAEGLCMCSFFGRIALALCLFCGMNMYSAAVAEVTHSQFILLYQKAIDRLTTDGSVYEYEYSWLELNERSRLQIAFEDNMVYETFISKQQQKSYTCIGTDYCLNIYVEGDAVDILGSWRVMPSNDKKLSMNQTWEAFLGVIPGSGIIEPILGNRLNADVGGLLEKLSNVSITESTLDDSRVVICKGNVGNVSLILSLDKDRGYITKKLFFENTNPELGKTKEFTFTVLDFYEVEEGLFIPKRINTHHSAKGGQKGVITFDDTPQHHKYELVYTKKDASSFIAGKKIFEKIRDTIPNGTPVAVQDAPQIEYVWMDGKIEPKTDEVMLKIAQGDHKFIPGADEPRFWIMALGAILIIVGFTFKGIELYKKWHENDDKKGDDKKEESKKEDEDKKQEGETP